ncbi:MAG: hypothetical protein ABIR59_03880 [Gemmatimonadales bacterium]
MGSPVTASPDPRAPRRVRVIVALVVAVPMLIAALLLTADGWRSDAHGAFLSRVLFALDRGQLELLGFEYPPLPFLMLLPSPTITWALILGALACGSLAWLVTDDCTERRSIVPLVMLVSVLWTPIGMSFVAGNFNEGVGLAALYVGWRHYRRWWSTRRTIHGLYTGLWLGLAFYTSPLGLALALVAGAVLPIIFPRLQIPPFASQLVLLVFPGFATTATWAYLSWVFTGRVAFPFTPWQAMSPGTATVLAWSLAYVAVSVLALRRANLATLGVLLPLVLLAGANAVGWHFSLGFAVLLLTLVAIVTLPRDLARPARALIGGVAILQAIAAWWLVPWPTRTVEDAVARAVATALASAPPRSVLIDDRWAQQMLKWAPSMEPYLTTRDTGFEFALASPQGTVQYVLATRDDNGLTLDADIRPPAGFERSWNWGGYTLFRRTDAPPLPVRYDAVLDVPRSGHDR